MPEDTLTLEEKDVIGGWEISLWGRRLLLYPLF